MVFPTELGILTTLAVLAASLWIPYIVGVTSEPAREGAPDPFLRPPDHTLMRPWVHRAHRAHLNLLEQFLPFAVIVLILDRVDGFNVITLWAALAFLGFRIVHAVGMISGKTGFPARPLIFNLGWVCILLLASQVFF